MEKIFLIGRRRTGTGSVVKGLNLLKYKKANILTSLTKNSITELILKMNNKEICAVPFDFTINDIRAIEQAYPSCRFIHTERNVDEWYSSFLRYYNKDSDKSSYKNKGYYVNDFYTKYNLTVRSHFLGREWKILYIKYGYNSSWGTLCSFVKKAVPNVSFPHENKLS